MRNGSMFPLSSEFSLYNIWTNNFWTVQIQISLATRVFGLRGSDEKKQDRRLQPRLMPYLFD